MAQMDDVLLITLDSCRFDTFLRARTPVMDKIGPLHKAKAPSYFTFASHASMWVGFTPGLSWSNQAFLNPKRGKLFRLTTGGFSTGNDAYLLEGSNIIEGFRKLGYLTVGSGAVGWFDPKTPTGRVLGEPFDHFWYSGNVWSLRRQLQWINKIIPTFRSETRPTFIFLNIGETHVPYWHEEAKWTRDKSPCIPFGGPGCSRRESRRRQRLCLQWIDTQLSLLIERYLTATVLICADHGDCWGEDGLWEHGINHTATLDVPLLIRHKGSPVR